MNGIQDGNPFKGYHIFGTQTPHWHVTRWQSTGGLCTEDKNSGTIYKERLFDLNSGRKKSKSRGTRKPHPNVSGRVGPCGRTSEQSKGKKGQMSRRYTQEGLRSQRGVVGRQAMGGEETSREGSLRRLDSRSRGREVRRLSGELKPRSKKKIDKRK